VAVKTKKSLEELVRSRFNDLNLLIEDLNNEDNNPFHKVYQAYDSGKVEADQKPKIIAGSYSYLGMGDHPRVTQAVLEAIKQFGTTSHGSRVLTGSTQIHHDLEKTIASFIGGESAITFPTGWITNFSTISSLFGPNDTIITDLKNHNSIHAGTEASGAKTIFFNAEKPSTLERALKKAGDTVTLVIIDSVFSMDGVIAPLPEILDLCKKYNAFIMIDEAHSIGVLGNKGKGITEYFGIDPMEIDILMGNTNKAIAGSGGYIVARKEITEFLRYRANGYLFSNAIPAHLIAASVESIKVIQDHPEIIADLREKHTYFRNKIIDSGFDPIGDNTPIIPIIYPDELSVIETAKGFWNKGIFVVPAIHPAVSKKTPRIRFCINVGHSYEDLDYIVESLIEISENSVIDLRT